MDYSKWDHIEISDDEDDTHPNVDTASLFKWRHEARLEREAEEKAEKAKRKAESEARENRIETLQKKLASIQVDGSAGAAAQFQGLSKELEELKQQQSSFEEKERELQRFEREHPKWNIDNISQDKQSRTIINKPKKIPEKASTPEEQMAQLRTFVEKHEKTAKQFAMLSKSAESLRFLQENLDLVCEQLASFLSVWCVDLRVEEKYALLERVARQAVCVQYILELAKTFDRDPRACVGAFYSRFDSADEQYHAAFNDELKAFRQRVEERYEARVQEARQRVLEERKAKLKPGELDPLEVLQSLPEGLRKAFETEDAEKVHEEFRALADQSMEEFEYHYKRLVDAGMWRPAPQQPQAEAKQAESNGSSKQNSAGADQQSGGEESWCTIA